MTDLWKRKLAAYLHDPPEKVLDIAWHKRRAEAYEAGLGLNDTEFARECDHTAAAADRLPWPRWQFLESAFDGQNNHFKHPLGGGAKFRIRPYPSADLAHQFASLNQPRLASCDVPTQSDRAQFLATWRLWRWWASDHCDSRLAFLPADTRLPDHTIWAHNSIVSALEACVTGEGEDRKCRPAFVLFQIGPVQDYIAQARRTLDLWSGSYLLSYLVGCGLRYLALNFGPDNVVFPNLCGQPIFDLLLKNDVWTKARVQEPSASVEQTLWDAFGYNSDYGRRRLLTPSLPNRFLAVLPADKADHIAREVVKAIRAMHDRIAAEVWKWAEQNLDSANCWTAVHRHRFDEQNQRFLDIAWQAMPWPEMPDHALDLTAIVPEAQKHKAGDGPRAGLHTILEMARRMSHDHRDVRNFQCERFSQGSHRGWKDRSKLKPDAKLDHPGTARSALYQLAQWQLDAVRRTHAWQAWSTGGWEVGREHNKDSLNGKEEALLDLRGPDWNEAKVEGLNQEAEVPNLFKPGELLGTSSLIKRLWPTAWLQSQHGFGKQDWRMPDTRHLADGQPFARFDQDRDFDSDADLASDRNTKTYFAVLALDGDEMGKWISGLHPKMPTLGEQLADYIDAGERKGAKAYFEKADLRRLLDRKRPLSPSFHLQFSEMLANFGNFCVRRIVEAHDGRLIYSGGDDVLALLPAHTAIACARALRAAFRGEPDALNQLQPTDVLFFRDGRPMEGSVAGHGAAWPLPNVTDAAFHAALHRSGLDGHPHDHRRHADRLGKARRFGSLVTAGPFPVHQAADGLPRWYFPRPLDLLDDTLRPTLAPTAAFGSASSSLPVPLKYAVANPLPPTKDNPAKAWLHANAFQHYLDEAKADIADDEALDDSAFSDVEASIGIAIDPESGTTGQAAAAGKIYSARYLRLHDDWRLGVFAKTDEKNRVSGRVDLIRGLLDQPQRLLVGGQQRVCTATICETSPLPLPRGRTDGFNDHESKWLVKWILLSPAIWPEIAAESKDGRPMTPHSGGWLPNWIRQNDGQVMLRSGERHPRNYAGKHSRGYASNSAEINARLVAAVVPKPLVITGWALGDPDAKSEITTQNSEIASGAKSTHLAVPAGAVYYFEADSQEHASKLANALNWHGDASPPDQNSELRNQKSRIANRRSTLMGEKGFGLGVCGTWNFFPGASNAHR